MPTTMFSCEIAGRPHRIEVAEELPHDALAQFDDFAIPDWLTDVGTDCLIRVNVDADAIDTRAHARPQWTRDRLALDTLQTAMLSAWPNQTHGMIAVNGICIEYHDRAYLFSSVPAVRAERHALLWREYLGDVVHLIGDGWIALSAERHGRDSFVSACGTPWRTRRGWSRNATAPLDGWCFISAGGPGDGAALPAGGSVRTGAATAGSSGVASAVSGTASAGAAMVDGATDANIKSASTATAEPPHPAARVQRLDASAMVDEAVRFMFMPRDATGVGHSLSLLDNVLMLTPTYRFVGGERESDVAASFGELTGERYDDRREPFVLPLIVDAHTWD